MTFFGTIWQKLSGGALPARRAQSANAGQIGSNRALRGGGVLDDDSQFRFPASDNLIGDVASEQLFKVIRAYAPGQPTQDVAQFAGRNDMLENVIAAVEEHRNHLVLFGGRGTGKTSLAFAMIANARKVGYHCAYISSTRESTPESIFRSALAELPIRFDQHFDPRVEDSDPTQTFDSLLPEGSVTPQALVDILARIRGTRLLIVIDEFDRNENATLTRDLTEIIKVISDRAIPVQIVIVGVGDVVDNLVGEHSSIARVLYAVRLSAMSDQQIRDIMAVASHASGVALSPEATQAIVEISYGRPYIARLVGLKTAKMALLRGSKSAGLDDFRKGTDELLGYLSSAGFGKANSFVAESPRLRPFFVAVLRCRRDAADRFTAADVAAAMSEAGNSNDRIAEIRKALDVISSTDFGLLNVHSGESTVYQFVDPRAELCVSVLCGRMVSDRPAVDRVARAEQA
jgi:AAA domain